MSIAWLTMQNKDLDSQVDSIGQLAHAVEIYASVPCTSCTTTTVRIYVMRKIAEAKA